MRYTLDFKRGYELHTFIPRDNTGKIELVVPNQGFMTYNVAHGGVQENDLSHREIIVKYYDPNDHSPFGIALLRATEMYLELEEGI